MSRNLKNAKNVVKYLERRYGSIKNHTISDDISLVNDICKHHELEEIKMMKNRINATIGSNRDSSYVGDHFNNLFVSFFTIISTLVLASMTIVSQTLDAQDFTSPMSLATEYIIYLFLFFSLSNILFMHIVRTNSNRIYKYAVLIEESFDKKKESE